LGLESTAGHRESLSLLKSPGGAATMLTELDHIILGVNDLDRGVAWVEQLTGVRAVFGGVHPGRGTRNALLALGPECYLEILAPDPQQSSPTWFKQLLTLAEPRLIAWAVHTNDLSACVQAAQAAGLPIDGPQDGARARPDGKTLRWKSFRLQDDRGGLLPFFIEWDRDSPHPAADASAECRIVRHNVQSPDAPELIRLCQTLAVQVQIEPAEKPRMVARLASPRGDVELTS
jgi:hypothetical protein